MGPPVFYQKVIKKEKKKKEKGKRWKEEKKRKLTFESLATAGEEGGTCLLDMIKAGRSQKQNKNKERNNKKKKKKKKKKNYPPNTRKKKTPLPLFLFSNHPQLRTTTLPKSDNKKEKEGWVITKGQKKGGKRNKKNESENRVPGLFRSFAFSNMKLLVIVADI